MPRVATRRNVRGTSKSSSWRWLSPKSRPLRIEPLEDRRLLSLLVSGCVWKDVNNNGIHDAGEPGMAAAVVELYQTADSVVGNSDDVSLGHEITGVTGDYSFPTLSAAQKYYLAFRAPVGYTFTSQNVGGDRAVDSDPNSLGTTAIFTPSASEGALDLDVGLVGATPSFGFALRVGGIADDDQGTTCAVDASGNAFVAGSFSGTVDFDPGPGVYNLVGTQPGTGYQDVFIAKYSSVGALVWARRIGGPNVDNVGNIVLAPDGGIVATGNFAQTADFDPGPGVYSLTAIHSDIFVLKLDSDGNFLWVRAMGGSSADSGNAVAIGDDGSIYTTGYFRDSADFDPGPGVYYLNGAYTANVFISKLDSGGNFIWAKGIRANDAAGAAIAIAPNGNVWVTGSFAGSADFDPGPGTYTLTAFDSDAYVLELGPEGTFAWAGKMGGVGADGGRDLVIGLDSQIYIGVATTGGDLDPGPGIANFAQSAAYLVKLNDTRSLQWARAVGPNGSSCKMAIGPDGDVYASNSFNGTFDFDPGTNIYNLTSTNSSHDLCIVRLNPYGEFVSATSFGGTGSEFSDGLIVAEDGSVYTTGSLAGAGDFDPSTAVFSLPGGGSYTAMFLCQLRVNRAPNDIALSPAVVPHDSPLGYPVGRLSAIDPDTGESFSYDLLDSAEDRFLLDDDLIRVDNGAALTSGTHDLVVRVHDSFGAYYDKTLTISVTEQPSAHIVGERVWHDLDGNGVQDADEPGVAGVAVELFMSLDATVNNDDDASLAIAISDADGNFSLGGLLEGVNYYLVFRTPKGYSFTLPHVGNDPEHDSDADCLGFTNIFTVSDVSDRKDIDAGLLGSGSPYFGTVIPLESTRQSVTTDADGSIYITGAARGSIDFDGGPGSYMVALGGSTYLGQFIAKYTSAGALCWAREIVDNIGYTDYTDNDIAVGADGSVYVTGAYKWTNDFDPGLHTFNLTPVGNEDAFAVRFDSSGQFIWAASIGGGDSDRGRAIAVGSDGSAYIGGQIGGNVLVWKLSPTGSQMWLESEPGALIYDLALGTDECVYLTGSFHDTFDCDPSSATYNLVGDGAFVWKLTSDKALVWAEALSGGGAGKALALGAHNEVYIAGPYYSTSGDFDPGPGVYCLPSGSVYLEKLDSAGGFLWAKTVHTARLSSYTTPRLGLALDAKDQPIVTGAFQGSGDFDPGPNVYTLSSTSGSYVSQLDAMGNLLWVVQPFSSGYCFDVAASPDCSLVLVGEGGPDFDPRGGAYALSGGFALKLLPNNHAPNDVTLTPSGIPEHCPKHTVVGDLRGIDSDPEELFTFELLDSAGGRFELTGSQIRVELPERLDFDTADSHEIRVRVRDTFGVSYDKTFTIHLTKVSETRSVGDRVWNDLNGNGLQDAGEPGVAGAIIEAFQSFDNVLGNDDDISWGQTATDADGHYALSGLFTGLNYYLVFRAPQGFVFTTSDIGGDETLDSDADSTGLSPLFAFSPGVDRVDLDAGFTGAPLGFGYGVALGGINQDLIQAITTDAAGNVYVTGYFYSTVDFDPGPGVYNLTSLHAAIFVAKYSPSGALYWARQAGGTRASGTVVSGCGIAVASDGSVYTTGCYNSNSDFAPGMDTFNLIGAGSTDSFIWKLDAAGNFVWARSLGGSDYDGGNAIAIAPDGGILTTGFFSRTADFDPGPGTFNLTAATNDIRGGIYVSKLDASGNFIWAYTPQGTCSGRGNGIAVGPDGSVYTAGEYAGITDFDPASGVFTLTSSGTDAFLWKLDAAGKFVWAKRTGGSSTDYARGVAIGPDGSIYTTGCFRGTVDFDPGQGGWNDSSSSTEFDAYVSKLDPAGNFAWARRLGSTGVDEGNGVAVAPDGSVFTIGRFQGTVDFDPGAGMYNRLSKGTYDVFVSKLDTLGNFLWATSVGGTIDDCGNAIVAAIDGSIYTAGYFQNTADFDPGPNTLSFTSAGNYDAFVSKFHDQVLSCDQIGTHFYGDTFAISGSASSGLPAAYSVLSGPASLHENILTVNGVGTVIVEIRQNGNDSYLPAAPIRISFVANPAPLVVTADSKAKVFGAAVPTLTASYSGFVNGETAADLASLATVSTVATATSLVGFYPITVSGAASPNYTISYVNGTLTITPAATTTGLAGPAWDTGLGQTATFTAHVAAVAPGAGTPTGSVTFKEGTTVLGTAAVDANGVASFSTAALGLGNHTITASYGGDNNFTLSTTNSVTHTVVQNATSLALTTSSNPAVYGQRLTFTATVAAAAGVKTPSGWVTFYDGDTIIGREELLGGVAQFVTTALPVGDRTITAFFEGTAVYAPSAQAIAQTVNRQGTNTSLVTSVSSPIYGQDLIFTATVKPVLLGSGPLTGTVSFMEGSTLLGTAELNAQKQAKLTINTLSAGTHTITAIYNGDTNFTASSADIVRTVGQASTRATLSSSSTTITFGQMVTLIVTLDSVSPSKATPDGVVVFKDGAIELGTATIDSSGRATLVTSALSVGTHKITGVYAGNANFKDRTTSIVTIKVLAPSGTAFSASTTSAAFSLARTATSYLTDVALTSLLEEW